MKRINRILEGDYGCEERMPGENVKAIVYLECEDGSTETLVVEDCWLVANGLDEGSIWPESDFEQ